MPVDVNGAIRPMTPADEPRVRAIYLIAHPGWPAKSRLHYWAHPTLVLDDEGGILGFTSYTVGVDELGLLMYGDDLCVMPAMRGRGYGRVLAEARLDYGRDVGCTRFLGATQPDNQAMQAILEAQGFDRLPLPVPRMFPHNVDAILMGGSIQV